MPSAKQFFIRTCSVGILLTFTLSQPPRTLCTFNADTLRPTIQGKVESGLEEGLRSKNVLWKKNLEKEGWLQTRTQSFERTRLLEELKRLILATKEPSTPAVEITFVNNRSRIETFPSSYFIESEEVHRRYGRLRQVRVKPYLNEAMLLRRFNAVGGDTLVLHLFQRERVEINDKKDPAERTIRETRYVVSVGLEEQTKQGVELPADEAAFQESIARLSSTGLEEIDLNREDLYALKKELRASFLKGVLSDGAIKGIIQWRRKGNRFADFQQLTQIRGIGRTTLEIMKPRLKPFSPISELEGASQAPQPPQTQSVPPLPARLVLRTVIDSDKTIDFQEERGPRIVPGRDARFVMEPPPPPLDDLNQRREEIQQNLAQVRRLMVEAYCGFAHAGAQVPFGPIKTFIRQRILPEFQTVAPDIATSESAYLDLAQDLFWGLALRAGQTVSFDKTGIGVVSPECFQTQEPWQAVSYLDLTHIWIAKSRRVEGVATGSAFSDVAVYDPDIARSGALERADKALRVPPTPGTGQELHRLLTQMRTEGDQLAYYFGEMLAREEEKRHAEDAAWAQLFFGRDLRKHNAKRPLYAEALVEPHSFLDQNYWTPAKLSRNPSDMLNVGGSIHELAGQIWSRLQVMKGLLEIDRDDWAFVFFMIYFQEKSKEWHRAASGRAITSSPGYQGQVAGWFLNLLRSKDLGDAVRLVSYLKKPTAGKTAPGQKAYDLLRQIYDDNFLTDNERLALMTPNASEAGLEEQIHQVEERSGNEILAQAVEAVQGDGVLVVGPETSPAVWAGLEELAKYPAIARRMIFFAVDPRRVARVRQKNAAVQVILGDNLSQLTALLMAMPEADRVSVLGPLLAGQLEQQLRELFITSMNIVPLDGGASLRMILQAVGLEEKVLDQVEPETLSEQIRRRAA